MSTNHAREISILSSARDGLRYLSANDWTLVADKASYVRFKKGAVMVQKGAPNDGVLLLLKGTARVMVAPQSKVRILGPGEVCGEMSFLEDAPASASVIAEEEIEALLLNRATLESLFELFPHLASRFYRSLATNLSRRLRELIMPSSLKASSAKQ
ncbi:MAG TPA: cyclic nucleotide-binding domain-containing protein [Candidatus Binatia bacterium]|nr:cyclic nucleotide-binding domain-containing protein [Candidatus Binatia bacterium]